MKKATAGNLPVIVMNHQGWAAVEFTSPRTGEVSWQVVFESAPLYSFPVRKPEGLSVRAVGLDGAMLRWNSQYYLSSGVELSLDGELVGYSPGTSCKLQNLQPGESHTVALRTVWEDGTRSKEPAELRFRLDTLLQKEIELSELEPVRATIGWGSVEMNRSVSGTALAVGGQKFRTGIGTHAASDIEYDLYGMFDSFSGGVGVDEASEGEKGSVEFLVLADGRQLWRSGVLKKADGVKTFALPVSSVRKVVLRVTDGGDGIDYDHADWVDVKLERTH